MTYRDENVRYFCEKKYELKVYVNQQTSVGYSDMQWVVLKTFCFDLTFMQFAAMIVFRRIDELFTKI